MTSIKRIYINIIWKYSFFFKIHTSGLSPRTNIDKNSVKGQLLNIGFAVHLVFIAMTHLCYSSQKAAIDNT